MSMYLFYLVLMYFNVSFGRYINRLIGIKEGDFDVESNERSNDEKKFFRI